MRYFLNIILVAFLLIQPNINSLGQDLEEKKRKLAQLKSDSSGLTLALDIARSYKLNNPDSLSKYAQWVITALGDYPHPVFLKKAAEAQYDWAIARNMKSDFTGAIQCCEMSMQFYQDAKDPLGRLGALVFKAWVQYNKGDVLDAIENAEHALKSLKDREEEWSNNLRYQKILGNVYSDLGTYYLRVGDSDIAISYYESTLKIREKLDDNDDLAEAIMNLGRVLHDLGNYKDALSRYNQSLELVLLTGNTSASAYIYSNRGQLYYETGNLDLALYDFERGNQIRSELGDVKGMSNILRKIGELYFDIGELKKAKKCFLEAEQNYKGINYPTGMSYSLLAQARVSLAEGDSINGFVKAQDAYFLSRKLNSIKLVLKCAEFIQPLYKHYGMLAEALMAAEDVQKAQQQIKEEEAKEIILKQAYQEKQAASKRYIYLLIAGALVLLTILFLVFRAYRLKRKTSDLMEREKLHAVEKNKNIVDSIQYAQQLQQAILPPVENIKHTFKESFLIYWPKDIVAGDFYWLMEDDHYKLWAVADCTGHGVPGAMVSVVCSNALNRAAKEKGLRDPGKILDEVRSLVIETFKESQREVKDGMDIALCVYQKNTGAYQFAGANRPAWVLDSAGQLMEVRGNKQAIGFQHHMEPFLTIPLDVNSGDSIYLMTDGFADQFGGPYGKKYMTSKLKAKLSALASQPFELQKMNLEWEFNQWKGNLEQIDDVCIMAIKCF